VKEERYVSFVGYGGISVRRQGVQGLHVHVGMESAEECWRCLLGIAPWLPVVLALSANSPWLAGELTGMASNRAPILGELPRAAGPPLFGSYDEWEAWIERLVDLGVMQDYTRVWWDVRPHPLLGTLEVRVPDQPTDVRLSAAFAALLQGMCRAALDGALPGSPSAPDYAQNRWSAARFGPRARLLHPDGRSVATATALGEELIALARPYAGPLVERLDPSGCEADLQSAAGSPQDCAAQLVARTLA
jgi:carboxylate-amine ligase